MKFLSTVKDKVKIKAGDEYLPQVDIPTFLGVKLDPRLTWKPHLEEIEARGIRQLAVMRKLSGTKWGANSKILKTVYTGAVRPVLEYSSSSWIAAAKSTKSRLDRVQNRGLRTILGAMKTTPVSEMEDSQYTTARGWTARKTVDTGRKIQKAAEPPLTHKATSRHKKSS